MATLRVPRTDCLTVRQKAIEDASFVQASILKECADIGIEPPPYELSELIGKGSFGRVYKANGHNGQGLVAIKIISIEERDSLEPGTADTFGDILKEVNTLKLLSSSGAKNINTVIDVFLVGHSVWMVNQFCGGGSVATLMRPTGGLPEKWIIPILRDVAEAVQWVHKQGIIHRDIKCANVLITEAGSVQLCDFGVAGIIQTKLDKRSTVTGTLHWMAPELFDSAVSYGTEVDIWAFGIMAYEVATGSPPNATAVTDISLFLSYLKHRHPRLEGDQFSTELKDFVAFCLVEDPAKRPQIEQIQMHRYIFNTGKDYPTSSLSELVDAYRLWEVQGGSRQSLFSAGGAQRPMIDHYSHDNWNFATIQVSSDWAGVADADSQTAVDSYSSEVDHASQSSMIKKYRRRLPPIHKPPIAPLEKVFNPHTITNYDDNARAFYGRPVFPSASDLPLRSQSPNQEVRESLIDLDAALGGDDLADLETIKARATPATICRPKTQDWTFPLTMPASADSEDHEFLEIDSSLDRPAQIDHLGDLPVFQTPLETRLNRSSAVSLIDLDAGLPYVEEFVDRPSTANSDTPSTLSDAETTPFDLETCGYNTCAPIGPAREPSLYVSDDLPFSRDPGMDDSNDMSSDAHPNNGLNAFGDHLRMQNTTPALTAGVGRMPIPTLPQAPQPPPEDVILGRSSSEEVKDELQRMIASLDEHLRHTLHLLDNR